MNREVKIPLSFQNQSLVVRGRIRTVALAGFVRILQVNLGKNLNKNVDKQTGWRKYG